LVRTRELIFTLTDGRLSINGEVIPFHFADRSITVKAVNEDTVQIPLSVYARGFELPARPPDRLNETATAS
jgi:hypothetical protein